MRIAAAVATALVASALAAGGCAKKNADTSAEPATTGQPAAVPAAGERIAVPGGGPATGGPAIGGDPGGEGASKGGPDTSFKLAVNAPATATVGTETTAKVVVTPGAGWKMNHEYPTKLKLAPSEGVTLSKPTLELADAKLEDQKLEFDVKLTPAVAGTHKVGGEIKFAVCTPETCDPKKQEIAFEVVAK